MSIKRLIRYPGGRPFSNTDVEAIQQQLDHLQGLYQQAGPFVVSGCDVTVNGSNWDISAGVIMLNGKLCHFAGVTNLATPAPGSGLWYWGESASDTNSRPYPIPANNQNAMREHTAVLTQDSGGGANLPAGDNLMFRHQKNQKYRALGDAIESLIHAPGELRMIAVGGQTLDAGRGDGADGISPGWRLCNGWPGLADMRNRFPVGSEDQYAVGDTGGADEVTLTAAQSGLPAHQHNTQRNGGGSTGTEVTSTELSTSPISGPLVEANAGQNASQAHENRPPYFAVKFFQWIGTDDLYEVI